MRVTLDELEATALALFQDARAMGISALEIPAAGWPAHWWLPACLVHDVNRPPDEFTLGELGDDIEQLKKIAADPDQAQIYAIVWLATVLRYLGEHGADLRELTPSQRP